ncbi:hypothetical protein [Bradyrhizobium elkanii]|uniref:hypothetical protein n=1 Tax=Bradyrhizobium elkanii TaxID=29448 RepID=UPI00086C9968|nr:hypothetical protein [Bradyrhizobium elkanii]ODM71725.1 hypothetical protein A6X20_07225 [Bradyrhizobium elkanii]ODM79098.1 hypothetical protein A6452_28810 [Bradyrhizobium elkanii]
MPRATLNRQTMPISWFADDAEFTRHVPFRWAICQNCEGHATDRGASVECDGGGFTSSEWAEQDDDFKQNYLNGVYDRPCTVCDGLGRVKEPELDALEPDELAAYEQSLRDDADYRALCRAEARMGA